MIKRHKKKNRLPHPVPHGLCLYTPGKMTSQSALSAGREDTRRWQAAPSSSYCGVDERREPRQDRAPRFKLKGTLRKLTYIYKRTSLRVCSHTPPEDAALRGKKGFDGSLGTPHSAGGRGAAGEEGLTSLGVDFEDSCFFEQVRQLFFSAVLW